MFDLEIEDLDSLYTLDLIHLLVYHTHLYNMILNYPASARSALTESLTAGFWPRSNSCFDLHYHDPDSSSQYSLL